MSLRNPLARAKGLGSAKDGTSHWWHQRLTAIALALLTPWFVMFAVNLLGASHLAVRGAIVYLAALDIEVCGTVDDPRRMLQRFVHAQVEQQGQMWEDHVRACVAGQGDAAGALIAAHVRGT